MEQFDEHKHEQHLAIRYAKLARYEAFNRFVDMALDGVCSRGEAIHAFVVDQQLHNSNVIPIDFTPRTDPPPLAA
jgi:hypothetical protein